MKEPGTCSGGFMNIGQTLTLSKFRYEVWSVDSRQTPIKKLFGCQDYWCNTATTNLWRQLLGYKVLKRARQALSRSQNGLSGFRKSGSKRPWLTLWRGGTSLLYLYQPTRLRSRKKGRRWGKQHKWSKVPYDTISVFLQVITLTQFQKHA